MRTHELPILLVIFVLAFGVGNLVAGEGQRHIESARLFDTLVIAKDVSHVSSLAIADGSTARSLDIDTAARPRATTDRIAKAYGKVASNVGGVWVLESAIPDKGPGRDRVNAALVWANQHFTPTPGRDPGTYEELEYLGWWKTPLFNQVSPQLPAGTTQFRALPLSDQQAALELLRQLNLDMRLGQLRDILHAAQRQQAQANR